MFLIVEVWPLWYVLDGNFIDIFLKYRVLLEQKDLLSPLLLQENVKRGLIPLSNHLNNSNKESVEMATL
jgi:hypothetical protein